MLDELNQLLEGLSSDSVLDDPIEDVLELVDPPADSLTGLRLGEWMIEEEIGRGGMSVVYRAVRRGERFEQVAALKVLSIDFLSEGHIESFHRECQALSALNHPGIAKLIHSGVSDRVGPYMIIERIDGQPIDDFVREQHFGPRECAKLILSLTRAVAHAHRHLFVHRDIKPGNVLVDHRSDPHLLDFGVVQWLQPDQGEGTLHAYSPGFAAPEQIKSGEISISVDIYSLGRLLHHLLGICGRDSELEAIADKAARDDPDERYASAVDLASDLESWLTDYPVAAVGASWAYRSSKFARRNWRWLGLAAVLIVTVAMAALATGQKAREARLQAERHQAVADFMLGLFEQADILNAGADMRVTDLLDDAAERAPVALADQPEALVSLYSLIASGQTELTNYNAAEAVLERARSIIDAYEISKSGLAAFHIVRARLLYELGDFEFAAAEAGAALSLLSPLDNPADQYFEAGANRVSYLIDSEQFEEALELSNLLAEQVQDADVAPVVRTLLTHRRAVALEVNGRVENAIKTYQKAIALQSQAEPKNELGRAQILNDYGIALYASGQPAAAETTLRETLAIFRSHFEEPHPRISSALHNIAFAILDQGRTQEAAEMLEQTLAMSVSLHGEDHVDTILERVTYGVVLQQLGDSERAELIFRESLSKLARVAPDMHVMQGAIHSYLADLYFQKDEFERAHVQYSRALELFSELPNDHPRIVSANERLAEIQTRLDTAP